jgi:hypothetical protein
MTSKKLLAKARKVLAAHKTDEPRDQRDEVPTVHRLQRYVVKQEKGTITRIMQVRYVTRSQS